MNTVVESSKAEVENLQHLLVLSGGGDTDVRLVTQAVWEWIFTGFKSEKSAYYEEVPAEVLAEAERHQMLDSFKDGKLYVTCGSYENDRALAAPGIQFRDVANVIAYAKTNEVNLGETFDGYIY
ncbi:hypothetical protein [Paraburkholderia sp. A3RO-2L]|jgi:hypothetical protein|uniref:hypothetical protein n=1 Tax=Paraburkholderia sp. A3RO-2L TaxID=3028376 RepID=UPI003DA7F76D